jgi:hypothetical protein
MTRNITISNTDDTIDSRDVIARIEQLTDAMEELNTAEGEMLSDDDRDELYALKTLAKQGEDYAPDWESGETLIRDTYFKSYAQELAEECGMIPDDAKWPLTCIDWDQAARELRMDYSAIEFNGVTYWVR